jgi:hypothetical protein
MAGKKPHKADPTVAKAKRAIATKLEQTVPPLSVDDICELCTALAKLTQAERRQQEGDWGDEL